MLVSFRWGNIISLLIFGAIVGWLASLVLGRNREMGCLANIVVGVLGSLLAGFLMPYVFPGARRTWLWGINLYSIGMGVVGAVVLLGITGWFRRKRK